MQLVPQLRVLMPVRMQPTSLEFGVGQVRIGGNDKKLQQQLDSEGSVDGGGDEEVSVLLFENGLHRSGADLSKGGGEVVDHLIRGRGFSAAYCMSRSSRSHRPSPFIDSPRCTAARALNIVR